MTRRQLLGRGAAVAAGFALGDLLQGCGSSVVHRVSSARFEPAPGSDIPSVEVPFAMWPFGDTTIGFVGIEQGFFNDVGIWLAPAAGETRLGTQTPGELLSGQLDVASGYMPIQIESFPQQPQIKMIQFCSTYVGNYLLASPATRAKTYEDFSSSGENFEAAAKAAIQQVRGKRVAFGTGGGRQFFAALLNLGGLTPRDFKLTAVDDSTILQLARAGDIDFAVPAGAAQNVVLINEGYERVFGIGQLLQNLPPGDPRVANALGESGLVSTDDFISANTATILRFMSVYYRIIDQMLDDPSPALRIMLPHLNAATGLSLTLADAGVLFKKYYELISFERTPDYLLNKRFPLGIDNIYVPQIEAAKKAGVFPHNNHVVPQDIFVGTRLYLVLDDLKRRYEALKGSRPQGTGLATKAEEQYRNRNYLDAYRLLRAA